MTDDNPFSRPSAWPKMPQAPFRIGPLPKAAPAPALTPVSRGVLSGGVLPGAGLGGGPMGGVMGASKPPVAVESPPPPPASSGEPAAFEVLPVEVIPPNRQPESEVSDGDDADHLAAPEIEERVLVAPIALSRRKIRRSRRPLIAAAAVLAIGVGVLAALLATRGGGPEPSVTPAPPPEPPSPPAVAASAPASPSPPAASAEPAASPPAAPSVRVASAARTIARRAAPAPRVAPPSIEVPPPVVPSPGAPPIATPAPLPVPPAPAPVQIAPRPPPPADPQAPIPTHSTPSE